MHLKSIELTGFKSFGKKAQLEFQSPIAGIVGPNGSGKSNVAEAFRFVLGEQSMKSLRSKKGEDLIWGGSPSLPRSNRAGVRVTFDNKLKNGKRLLDLDFDEVQVERVVHRDGLNEYLLNGTQVRLKDVIRLLAGANIGGSGYHIISQGEADRILNAPPRERREMVEDALGLKLYQHKKAESERKLEETGQNIEKTKSLRREIGPHLNFLRIQVEKIEKARDMKDELGAKLKEYLSRENAWITQENARLNEELRVREHERNALVEDLRAIRTDSARTQGPTLNVEGELRMIQGHITDIRRKKEELSRELGRAEGALEVTQVQVESIVPAPQVRSFARDIESAINDAESAHDVAAMREVLDGIRARIRSFIEGLTGAAPVTNEEVRMRVEELKIALVRADEEETRLVGDHEVVRGKIEAARESRFATERTSIELDARMREAESAVHAIHGARGAVASARARFEEEVREGIVLAGYSMMGWDTSEIPQGALSEDRNVQEKRRREIERLKIKIEESGLANGDEVVREFKSTKERDEFLAKELVDLETSALSLRSIITELESTIDERFTEGLGLINEALQRFFSKLFGGGEAILRIEKKESKVKTDDDGEEDADTVEDDVQAGLGISVSLPRKKIRGLESLSGGERALTSIAMIFSMTQVNPPPFLILDETDAALDEANSKRYADMIRELGSHSQLIVITHNRATMSAAGELYGVTMAGDGVSKLLSVKLEEAESVAK